MNTYNVINEEVIVPDVPINKWFNVIIRCTNTTLDVYANGTIVRSISLMVYQNKTMVMFLLVLMVDSMEMFLICGIMTIL